MMELHQPRAAERYLPSNVLTGYFHVPAPLRPGKLLAQCRDTQMLIERHVPFSRHVVHAGDPVQSAGTRFFKLHLVHLGAVKTLAATGAGSLQEIGRAHV